MVSWPDSEVVWPSSVVSWPESEVGCPVQVTAWRSLKAS